MFKQKLFDLKKDRDAVILAHNYQLPEVQDLADFTGDSLELSIRASQVDAKVIVFCGVSFMAETAKILNPDKIVLMPDPNAGCPMADMIKQEDVIQLKRKHPNAKVVSYVNSSASVKAESDICCTSANAVKVVESIKDKNEIIFIPDKFLGEYVKSQVNNKNFIFWNGYCPTHFRILPEDVARAKQLHPGAVALVHPECRPETIKAADYAFSTGGMLKFVKESTLKEFIIGTEIGMIYRLAKDNPAKSFYPVNEKISCPNMKRTTAEKVLWALEDMKTEISVPKEIAGKAKAAIDKMLLIGRQD